MSDSAPLARARDPARGVYFTPLTSSPYAPSPTSHCAEPPPDAGSASPVLPASHASPAGRLPLRYQPHRGDVPASTHGVGQDAFDTGPGVLSHRIPCRGEGTGQ